MLNEVRDYLLSHIDKYYEAVRIHSNISVTAVLISIIIAVPLGIICAKFTKATQPIMNIFNLFRIIPSLAILVLVMPILGTGYLPALLALVILAIPPILINTYLGIKNIDASVLESAEGMGMDYKKMFYKIEIPLALPLIITGVRTSAVEVIASATLASYIGAGGLGDFIFTGLGMNDFRILIIGGATVALLSVIAEMLLFMLEQSITKYQRD
ncbi:ABC transporter permease [Clostridium estertheticum]|uniref:ABC transporter permease n=1 Tax=Clostridium estertheticum TaxID=238834 RepID=UPI0013EE8503|nr:ABC transporter permease [Clostridium estertheticum]MBZ9608790.1 ABC transporter permease [Clostridium estertheticum]